MSTDRAHVLVFFLDGVGLGDLEPEANPFVTARLPNLDALLGAGWRESEDGVVQGPAASLIPTDTTLGVPGRPQSATGQATILTGRNVPYLVGQHYGPKPNAEIREIVRQGTLFSEVVATGGRAALITPYPQGFFDAIASGKRLLSSVPLGAVSAGLELMGANDLREGRAVSPDFTAAGWRDYLGYADIPVLSYPEAGRQIARIAQDHHFAFFEHWPSDRAGHRGTLEQAVEHLEAIDAVLGELAGEWDHDRGLLIVTSDHGNIEEKRHGQHTTNPVPTILMGRNHRRLAGEVCDLTDIAAIVRQALALPRPPVFIAETNQWRAARESC